MNERPNGNVRKKQVRNKSRRNKNGSNVLIYAFLTITLISIMVVLSLTVFFKTSEGILYPIVKFFRRRKEASSKRCSSICGVTP